MAQARVITNFRFAKRQNRKLKVARLELAMRTLATRRPNLRLWRTLESKRFSE